MTEISAAQVKELRDLTGAPMMDAKRALVETEGDLEKAAQLLREKGLAAAAKRAGRSVTEGRVIARIENTHGAIVAVGSETEPVSKNDAFLGFAEKVIDTVENRNRFAAAWNVERSTPKRLASSIRSWGARTTSATSSHATSTKPTVSADAAIQVAVAWS